MAVKTLTWIAPKLCGCKLRIRADFVEGADNTKIIDNETINGMPIIRGPGQGKETYQQPIPHTIESLEIVSVCDEHKEHTKKMYFDQLDFFDLDHTGKAYVQKRGYLSYPIKNPTSAEMLYTYLYSHGGTNHTLPCGCKTYFNWDKNAKGEFIEGTIKYHENHPLNTSRCLRHHNDVGHEQALEENRKENLKAEGLKEVSNGNH